MFRCIGLVLLLLGIIPASTFAQDDDLQTYTWLAGGIAFDYPADWVARDDLYSFSAVSIGTSLDAIDATTPPAGEIMMQVSALYSTQPASLERLTLDEFTPSILLSTFQQLGTNAIETVEYGGQSVATLTVHTPDLTILLLSTNYHDQALTLSFAAGAPDVLEQFRDTIFKVATSIRPAEIPNYHHEVTPVHAPATGEYSGVAWIFQGDLATYAPDGVAGSFGRLALGQAEIFVATGGHNLLVLTVDGVLDRIINNDLVYFHDVAVDADGTLWALDRNNLKIWHLSSDGEILSAFGAHGTGADYFGTYGASDLALDDSYLYVLTTALVNSYTVEDVQVWRRDGEFIGLIVSLPRDGGLRDSSLLVVDEENIYVAAGGIYLYSAYDKQGTLDYHLPALLQMSYPGALAFALDDDYIFFETLGTIYRYNATTGGIDLFGQTISERSGEIPSGELFYPRGLVVLPDGDLIVADANETHWQVLRVTTGISVDATSP